MDELSFQFSSLTSDSFGFQLSAWDTPNDINNDSDDSRSSTNSSTESFCDQTFALDVEDPSGCYRRSFPSKHSTTRNPSSSSKVRKTALLESDNDSVQCITWKRNGPDICVGRTNARKVRFCRDPPEVLSVEKSDRNDYCLLYYSAHELQKMIDESNKEHTESNK